MSANISTLMLTATPTIIQYVTMIIYFIIAEIINRIVLVTGMIVGAIVSTIVGMIVDSSDAAQRDFRKSNSTITRHITVIEYPGGRF